jgi:predicted ArsR family transcriptional regulator
MTDTRQKVVELLARGDAGTDALARDLGITVTAVRQHLVALERDGLVERGGSVPSGGRPQHMYRLTAAAKETFPRQYSWFSGVLLDAMKKELGSGKMKKTLRILGQDAGGGQADGSMKERTAALVGTMQKLGYDARVVDDGVAARNCVFHKLAVEHPEVCSFDLGLIETVAGADVEHTECIATGGRECRFRLRKRS